MHSNRDSYSAPRSYTRTSRCRPFPAVRLRTASHAAHFFKAAARASPVHTKRNSRRRSLFSQCVRNSPIAPHAAAGSECLCDCGNCRSAAGDTTGGDSGRQRNFLRSVRIVCLHLFKAATRRSEWKFCGTIVRGLGGWVVMGGLHMTLGAGQRIHAYLRRIAE